MTLIPSLLILAFGFLAALGLTAGVRRMLVARAILDQPNERSSHTIPTPRGGGLAIVIVLLFGILITFCVVPTTLSKSPLVLAIALLACISWLDDRRGLNPVLRLGAHLVAAFLGTLALPDHALLLGGLLPYELDRAVMIMGWAWFMNLYNFMDGIDGITGVETVSIATGVCLIMAIGQADDHFIEILTLLLTGTMLGFLAFNWHPAKIFLGDVGSVPLGFLTGFALLTLATQGFMIPALILPLYYLADSGITITKRAVRGEKIWQAHRQHFYQRAAAVIGRHDYVAIRVLILNIFLISFAMTASAYPYVSLLTAIAAVTLTLGWMHKMGTR